MIVVNEKYANNILAARIIMSSPFRFLPFAKSTFQYRHPVMAAQTSYIRYILHIKPYAVLTHSKFPLG